MNVACNELAGETTAAALGSGKAPERPVLEMPYERSRTVLKIGGTWVTLRYHKALYNLRKVGLIRAYMLEKYGWTREVYELLHWRLAGMLQKGGLNRGRQGRYCMSGHQKGMCRDTLLAWGSAQGVPVGTRQLLTCYVVPGPADEEVLIECIKGGNEKGCEEEGPTVRDGGYFPCPLL